MCLATAKGQSRFDWSRTVKSKRTDGISISGATSRPQRRRPSPSKKPLNNSRERKPTSAMPKNASPNVSRPPGMREEWTVTTLGQAAEVVMGQSPPGSTYNNRGDGLPFIQGSAEFGDHSPVPL